VLLLMALSMLAYRAVHIYQYSLVVSCTVVYKIHDALLCVCLSSFNGEGITLFYVTANFIISNFSRQWPKTITFERNF